MLPSGNKKYISKNGLQFDPSKTESSISKEGLRK
jgi:hypothetical protein